MQRYLSLPRLIFLAIVSALLLVPAIPAAAGDMNANEKMFTEFVNTVINEGKVDMVDTYLAENFVDHEAMPPGIPEGRAGCQAFFTMYLAAFPDTKVTIDDMISQDDKVVARQTWTGTNKGEFMGMPATGNKVSFTVIDIIRFENGKAVEHWGAWDQGTMMMQLDPEKHGMMGQGMEKAAPKPTGN